MLILGFLNLKDNADAKKNKQISRFIIMKVRAFLPSISVAGTDVSLQFYKIRKSFDDFRIYPTFIIKTPSNTLKMQTNHSKTDLSQSNSLTK